MLFFSILILYLNYLIPNKMIIFKNISNNFGNLIGNIMGSISYIYEICLALYMIISLIFVLILILGSFTRILKVLRRKTRKIKVK